MKAFLKKVRVILGKGLKLLNMPLWALYDILIGVTLGSFIYIVLGHYLGHGLTPSQVAAGMIATSPFQAYALPLGIGIGIVFAVALLYLDIREKRKYGEL